VTASNPNRTRGILRLTLACNERCVFCNEPTERYERSSVSPEAVRRQLQAFVRDRADTLTISGGEPTLSQARLLALIRDARRESIPFVVLQTNGVLIDEVYARALADAGLTEGFVSLLSHEPALHDALMGRPGAHAACLAGIDALISAQVAVTLNPVFARTTQTTVADYMDFVARRLGEVRSVSVSVLQPHGRAENQDDLLPDYAELGPSIREGLARADHHGLRAINPYCGVPPCVGWDAHLDRCTEALEALGGGLQAVPGIVNQGQKSHGPPCGHCALRPRCGGAWHAYWTLRQGSGIAAPNQRVEPWLRNSDQAPGQRVISAPGGCDIHTWEALDSADTPTVWLWTDRLNPGDAERIGRSPCTDLALELSVHRLASARRTLREARTLIRVDSTSLGAIRTRLHLALRPRAPRAEGLWVSGVALGAKIRAASVYLLVAPSERYAALVTDLNAQHPGMTVTISPAQRSLGSG
jgi:pyruvate-formate lyase-activating enzyme